VGKERTSNTHLLTANGGGTLVIRGEEKFTSWEKEKASLLYSYPNRLGGKKTNGG